MFKAFKDLRIGFKLFLGFGVVGGIFILSIGVGIFQSERTDALMRDITDNHIVQSRLLRGVADNAQDNMQIVSEVLITEDFAMLAQAKTRIEANRQSNAKLLKELDELVKGNKPAWYDDVKAKRDAFIKKRNALIGLMEQARFAEGRVVYDTELKPSVVAYKAALTTAIAAQEKESAAATREAHQISSQVLWIEMASVLLAVLLAGFVSWQLTRNVTRGVGRALGVAEEVSGTKLAGTGNAAGGDEIQRLVGALELMKQQLHERNERERVANTVNARVKVSLDNASTSLMIADQDRKIVYVNAAAQRMLRDASDDLRANIPGFDPDKILDAKIDAFHVRPERQVGILREMNGEHRAEFKVGPRTFRMSMNRVTNEQGQVLGYVVDWVDRTMEVKVQEEISSVMSAAVQGDFSQRIPLNGKSGFMLQMAERINSLMDVTAEGLKEVARLQGAVAEGDLQARMQGDYKGVFGELQTHANSSSERLAAIIQTIRDGCESINTAAREIAAGNTDLSSRTEEQASSLQETASSMEELTGTVKQNAENAKQANQLAVSASEVAKKGGEVVGQVVHTMGSIQESAKKIEDIISVIDGIAFQTNILALNAAVEAARAGEQGRGFAVVASEVRSLAQRSSAAAKEIKDLIGDSVGKVESGSKLVNNAGETMDEVVKSVKRVADIISEITAASMEQSAGIEQVNQAIAQMDQTTQQNAALVEEAAAAAMSMEEQARGLRTAVAVFRLGQDQKAPAAENVTSMVKAQETLAARSRKPKGTKRNDPEASSPPLPLKKAVGGESFSGDWKEI
ncbi:MAG: methyl-accepting chemotaxis protein [Burkholderiales bacterium]|nr:methyl-accepting chemotaxis protein [Burkholderiales bacterium]